MKTYLECLPCFLNQAINVMNLNHLDDFTKQKVIKELMIKLSTVDLNKKPPEFAIFVYKVISEITGNNDLYKEIKIKDNNHAISLLPEIKNIIKKTDDKLLSTIKVAIAGNIMDFVANSDYNLKKTVEEVIKSDFAINDYKKLKIEIINANSIAYLADNSGEIVFDRLLVNEIRKLNKCKIYFFVRDRPIVNDATKSDAEFIGIDKIENFEIREIRGGFPNISSIEDDLVKFIKKVDLAISKGQANYESLSEIKANIYFLLITKCSVIARDLGVNKGDIIIKGKK
ncbi:DUF89 family protein [Candidatus Woesearchaeota archaeon]|nr:DUF89 family protein [Candidatus Woesearchaeota archaeon]